MDNFSSTAQLTPAHAEAGASTPSGSRPDIQQQPPEQSTIKKTSDFGALAHMVKSSLGSGILAMPNAFRNGGLAFGLAATFIIGFICTYCVHLLVVQHHIPDLGWGVRSYMLVLLPVLALLCLPPTLRRLAPFSVVANFCIFVGFSITLYYIFREMPDFDKPLVAPPKQWPLYFSTVIFALEGIGMVLPVANNMKRPQHFLGCPGVLNVSMTVVVALYAIIGFFGYLRYGKLTEGSITLNLPVEEPLAQAVKLLVAGAVLLTYGLLLYVPNSVVLEALASKLPENPTARNASQIAFKLTIACLSVGVAAAVPSLGPVISLVGAIFVSTLGLLCPAVIDTVMRWEKPGGLGRYRWRLFTNGFIVLMSLGALLTGTYTSVLEILAEYSHS